MRIELIPLIELPTFKFPDLEGMTDLEKKNQLLIERNYSEVKNLKPFNKNQYRLIDLSLSDLKKAIDLHVSDIPISESCAFFGGYGLKINNEFVLFPQCCGLLSEINDWKKILNNNFNSFYLSECHPAPRFEKIGRDIIIECNSNHEDFHPKTQNQIVVNYTSLANAVYKVSIILDKISKKLDKFSHEYKVESIAKYLIWEE